MLPVLLFVFLPFTLSSTSQTFHTTNTVPSSLPLSQSSLRNSSQLSSQCLWAGKNDNLFFYDARNELGFHTRCPSATAPSFMSSSYSCLTFSINDTIVTYARAFKANSVNIIKSLLRMDNRPLESDRYIYLNHRIGASTRAQLTQNIHEEFGLPLSRTRSFGFYRDPLSHFISGLRESHYRFMCELYSTNASTSKSNSCSLPAPLEAVTHHLLIEMIHAILNCQFQSHLKYLRDILHISPQGHTILVWKPQFIGYLENFDHHWQELQQYLNLSIPYLSPHFHVTQSDPYHLKVTLLELFDLKPQYLRSICRFIMVDYMCLGFNLPLVCSDMLDEDGRYVSFQEHQQKTLNP
jgi:hypothetical protein